MGHFSCKTLHQEGWKKNSNKELLRKKDKKMWSKRRGTKRNQRQTGEGKTDTGQAGMSNNPPGCSIANTVCVRVCVREEKPHQKKKKSCQSKSRSRIKSVPINPVQSPSSKGNKKQQQRLPHTHTHTGPLRRLLFEPVHPECPAGCGTVSTFDLSGFLLWPTMQDFPLPSHSSTALLLVAIHYAHGGRPDLYSGPREPWRVAYERVRLDLLPVRLRRQTSFPFSFAIVSL